MTEKYSEHEMSLLNESKQQKRDSTESGKNKMKKRRSSMASSRRSITGAIDYSPAVTGIGSSAFPYDNQKGCLMLKPNPLNVRMDEIISQFEESIGRLNTECDQWKASLRKLEEESERAELLSQCNVSIQPEDISQEVKDMARSEFITCQTMDFSTLQSRAEKRLQRTYFNVEKCLQDMRMFRGTVNTIKCYNRLAQQSISDSCGDTNDEKLDDTVSCDNATMLTDNNGGNGKYLTDIKSQLEWLMNN